MAQDSRPVPWSFGTASLLPQSLSQQRECRLIFLRPSSPDLAQGKFKSETRTRKSLLSATFPSPELVHRLPLSIQAPYKPAAHNLLLRLMDSASRAAH